MTSDIECRYYLKGKCAFGEKCKFLHPKLPIPPEQRTVNISCKFYLKGYCHRGADCRYRHAIRDLPWEDLKQVLSHLEEVACGVCFENPSTFGLLDCCDHVFCLDCIKEWRKKCVGKEVHCPICRQKANHILPSSLFCPNGIELRDRLLANHRKAISNTQCNYQRDFKHCPFGDKCMFYHDPMLDFENPECIYSLLDQVDSGLLFEALNRLVGRNS